MPEPRESAVHLLLHALGLDLGGGDSPIWWRRQLGCGSVAAPSLAVAAAAASYEYQKMGIDHLFPFIGVRGGTVGIGVDYMAVKWRRMYLISLCFSRPLLFFPGMVLYRFPLTWGSRESAFFCEIYQV